MRLHEAARAGDVDLASAAVDAAVSRGVPLPAVVNAASDDVMRRSPLHLASEKGHVRAVRFLLSLRADPNVADVAGARPLHYAAAADRDEVARALLAASADARARRARGAARALGRRDRRRSRRLDPARARPARMGGDDRARGVDAAPPRRAQRPPSSPSAS